MDDRTWWAAQMSGARDKYALCSGGFDSSGVFVHDGRYCECGEFERLVARRVSKGYNERESRELLPRLLRDHSGDNLDHALSYNEFRRAVA